MNTHGQLETATTFLSIINDIVGLGNAKHKNVKFLQLQLISVVCLFVFSFFLFVHSKVIFHIISPILDILPQLHVDL